MRAVETLISRP